MPKAQRSPSSTKHTEASARRRSSIVLGMEAARFLTIDLEVRSRRSLAPLVSAWPQAYQPQTGQEGAPDSRWLIMNAFFANTAETAAKHLLGHIAKLKGKALVSWKQAHRRTFDIGVRAGGPGRAFEEVKLTADTLRRIAAVGAQIQVTVYPAEPKLPDAPGRNRDACSRSSRG